MYGHAETLSALLSHSIMMKDKDGMNDEDGMAPIHHAAKGNHVKALQCLLDAGVDPLSLKSKEDHDDYYFLRPSTLGKTPVEFACELGNADVVIELLLRLEPESRSSILPHWASATGQAKALSIFLQYPEILANINNKDECGNTPLFLAACARDPATVQILLDHGADMHARSDDLVKSEDEFVHSKAVGDLGRTPLQGWASLRRWAHPHEHHKHHASVEEWEKTGKILIEAGCDIEARDEKGQPILFAWTKQFEYGCSTPPRFERFVTLLLKYGANPRAADNEGNTILHQCWRENQGTGVMALLTKAGADINAAREGDLVTPPINAVKCQWVNVRAYLNNGADPNMQDWDGNTALHHICRSSLFEFSHVEEWLTFADPTIQNNKGDTCLYNLRFGNRGNGIGNRIVESIPLFTDRGLDLESRNRLGRTALLNACHSAEPHFIHGLLRYGANAKSKDFRNKSCEESLDCLFCIY
jgi:ankyrin repeat protein